MAQVRPETGSDERLAGTQLPSASGAPGTINNNKNFLPFTVAGVASLIPLVRSALLRGSLASWLWHRIPSTLALTPSLSLLRKAPLPLVQEGIVGMPNGRHGNGT